MNRRRYRPLLFSSVSEPEARVIRILQKAGYSVSIIVPNDGYKQKSADILINGKAWEIKSPRSTQLKSIGTKIRKATHQSQNVILDTSQTKLADAVIVEYFTRFNQQHKSLKLLKIITKSGVLIDIEEKDSI